MEEYAYVLDLKISDNNLVYLIGEKYYTLLTTLVKKNAKIKIGDRVYIGGVLEKRDVIEKIKYRISYGDLTEGAKLNLKDVLKIMISNNQQPFINFLNNAKLVNPRIHQLDFLPHIGSKSRELIISNRPYSSFEDFKNKTKLDPLEIFSEKLVREISDRDLVKFFVISKI